MQERLIMKLNVIAFSDVRFSIDQRRLLGSNRRDSPRHTRMFYAIKQNSGVCFSANVSALVFARVSKKMLTRINMHFLLFIFCIIT